MILKLEAELLRLGAELLRLGAIDAHGVDVGTM
jgi:hypothetical protein